MDNLSDRGVVRDLLSRHGFSFSKSMGQNFLVNPSVCPRMAEQSGADCETGVLEIGPGFGVLTDQLCRRAKKVVSLELDKRLFPVLEQTLSDHTNVTIIQGDVLKADLHEIIAREFPKMRVVVCANLPYYITSPVIMRLLEEQLPVSAVTVMVQKEAARRICALPGTREVGAVSLAVRYYSEPRTLFDVSRGSFMPAPNVDSAVVKLDIRDAPAVDAPPNWFFPVIKAAFSMRRKTLLNSLSSSLHIDKTRCAEMLSRANVEPGARAEQLTLRQFGDLAREYGSFIL